MAFKVRPSRALAAAGTTVVVIGVAVLAIALRSSGESARQPRAESVNANPGVVPTPDLPPRSLPAIAWTGNRLFVYGGEGREGGQNAALLFDDGALLTPGSGATESLPPSPLGPLFGPAALAVEGGVVVLGPSCRDLAPYDDSGTVGCSPGTYAAGFFDTNARNWREVAVPDALAAASGPWLPGWGSFTEGLGVTSGGLAVFAIRNVTGGWGAEFAEYWVFEAEQRTWRELPSPGVRLEAACLANDRLVVVTAEYEHAGVVLPDNPALHMSPGESLAFGPDDGYINPMVASLDLTNRGSTWQLSPKGPGRYDESSAPGLSCLGDDVLVFDLVALTTQYRYSFDGSGWTEPPAPPFVPLGSRVWAGRELVVLPLNVGEEGVAYDPAANTWRVLDGFTAVSRRVLWTGREIVGYSEGLRATSGVFEYELPG